jgi:hypothetical protein
MQPTKHLCSARVTDVSSVEDDAALEPRAKASVLARVGVPCAVLRTSYSLLPAIRRMTRGERETTLQEIKEALASRGLRLGEPLVVPPEPVELVPPTPPGPVVNLPKGPIELVDHETGERWLAPTWDAWEMSVPVAGYDLYVPGHAAAFEHLRGKEVELFGLAAREEQSENGAPGTSLGRDRP